MKVFLFVGALALIAQTALAMPIEDVQVQEQPFGLSDAEIREILEHAAHIDSSDDERKWFFWIPQIYF